VSPTVLHIDPQQEQDRAQAAFDSHPRAPNGCQGLGIGICFGMTMAKSNDHAADHAPQTKSMTGTQ
jgi:hypothetical protein